MTMAKRDSYPVTLYNPERAYNGFTLFAPLSTFPSNVWLIDMLGRLVHRWQWPGWIRLHAQLLPTGNILAGLRGEHKLPLAHWFWVGGEVIEMDWDGNIVWRYEDPYMNGHDRVRMKNGNTLIQKLTQTPEDIAAKIGGGLLRKETVKGIWCDTLQEITPDGKVVWEWVAYEHMAPEDYPINPLLNRDFWAVWNSVVELPDGNIMTCSPNLDCILIIDKATGDVKWRWGQGEISFPHNPTLLDNGNILLLDNSRFHPQPELADRSRIIEVNPRTNKIEWEYTEENPVEFWTPVQGSCQRLPNGNTLICETIKGRFFEITAAGEKVWEYVSPFYDWYPAPSHGRNNYVFRAHRYGPDYPGLQGNKLDPEKLDLWNRLYCPEAFGIGLEPSKRGTERAPTAVEEELAKKKMPVAKEEAKPSVAKPSAEKEVSKRTRLLGY